MSKQSKLIGKHPITGLFFDWCECEDTTSTSTKKHRKLTYKEEINRNILIEILADWIIEHHIKPQQMTRLNRKKEILKKHNELEEYIQDNMNISSFNLTTKKGNLGEIILAEYLTQSSGLELLVYKLRYNPNIEQSMKGDDILLFDKNNIKSKIIMGESKYRNQPNELVVKKILESLSKDSLPISLPFIRDRLDELNQENMAEQLDELIKEIKRKKIPIVYVGFLHSNHLVGNTVEKYLNTDNENLVLISYNERNPENLIKKSFTKAEEKMKS